MKVFTVGGCIRDEFLGFEPKDFDYAVVGATFQQMLDAKFTQVGKDFPVFLHPETADEYALARRDRKVMAGTGGFDCEFTPDITIEEDLYRRDLTINAMARDEVGTLIDPYNGMADIEAKCLRHVSDHFVEDPLRVLRVARFLARYASLGFVIAEETKILMRCIVDSGELATLTPERVLKELTKALSEPQPEQFFLSLREVGALAVVFPEIDALFGIKQVKKYHPEIDTGIHIMMCLQQAKRLGVTDFSVMFTVLVHDLGKAITPKDILPQHIGHELAGVPLVESMANRLKVDSHTKRLALFVTENHLLCHRIKELSVKRLGKLFKSADAWRRPELIKQFAVACKADARGRTGFEDKPYEQADYLLQIQAFVLDNLNNQQLVAMAHHQLEVSGLPKNQLGKLIHEQRTGAIYQLISLAKRCYGSSMDEMRAALEPTFAHFSDLSTEQVLKLFKTLQVRQSLVQFEFVIDGMSFSDELKDAWRKCVLACNGISGEIFVAQGLEGKAVGAAITAAMANAVQTIQSEHIKTI
jgi:tRNA nucleotidyltransferase (CCA-adding enzyme)